MKKLGISIFLALFVLLSFGMAGASTLTFDGLSNGSFSSYGGFTWANATALDDTLSISLDNTNENSVTSMSYTSLFNVTSADFLFSGTGSLYVIVTDQDFNIIASINLSADVAAPDVVLSGSNITGLYFGVDKGNATITNITIDNIDYTLNGDTVPEPATMILFGLGMLGIAGTARKKMSA